MFGFMHPVEEIGRTVKELEKRIKNENLAAEHALETLYKQIADTMILLVRIESQNNYISFKSTLQRFLAQIQALRDSQILRKPESRKNLDELIRLTQEHIAMHSEVHRHVFESPGERKGYYLLIMRRRFNETIGKELKEQYLTLSKARELMDSIG
jgi:hypothetical protein